MTILILIFSDIYGESHLEKEQERGLDNSDSNYKWKDKVYRLKLILHWFWNDSTHLILIPVTTIARAINLRIIHWCESMFNLTVFIFHSLSLRLYVRNRAHTVDALLNPRTQPLCVRRHKLNHSQEQQRWDAFRIVYIAFINIFTWYPILISHFSICSNIVTRI